MNPFNAVRAVIAILLAVIFVLISLFWGSPVHAGQLVMVAQYNEKVRIVLSRQPCPMTKGAFLAVAQRIDKQFMRGCYTYTDKMVRIQWSAAADDFSMLDATLFQPQEIN